MKAIWERISSFMTARETSLLVLFFTLAVTLRLVYLIIIINDQGYSKWIDDWEYYSMGIQISEGNWIPVINGSRYMQVGPGLPLLIALFIKIFGDPHLPVFIYNIIITSLIVPLLYFLGKDLFGSKVGWLTALWGILYIDFFKYNPDFLKEPTVFFFLPLTIFLLLKAIRSDKNLKYLFFSAISYGWLVHFDERYLVFFPFFVLAFFLIRPFKMLNIIRSITFWICLILLIMLPWTIHNYKIFGQVVLISPRTTAFTSKVWGKDMSEMEFKISQTTGNYNTELKKYKADQYEKSSNKPPREYKGFELYMRAFINFWQPAYFRPTYIQYGGRFHHWSLAHNISGILFYGIFLPFFLIGIIIMMRKKYLPGLFFTSLPIIHSVIHTYMVWPLERYRSPIVFIVVMTGFYSIVVFFEKWQISYSHNNS